MTPSFPELFEDKLARSGFPQTRKFSHIITTQLSKSGNPTDLLPPHNPQTPFSCATGPQECPSGISLDACLYLSRLWSSSDWNSSSGFSTTFMTLTLGKMTSHLVTQSLNLALSVWWFQAPCPWPEYHRRDSLLFLLLSGGTRIWIWPTIRVIIW